jgi:group I intron endonuclease
MNDCGIYRLDFPNGYFYIGSAISLAGRAKRHRGMLESGNHYNKWMQNVYNKHGDFTISVLHRISKLTRYQWEQSYLDEFVGTPGCMNHCTRARGGPGYPRGRKMSDETKAKISAAKVGKPGWSKGIPKSDETKAKLSASLQGRTGPWAGKKRGPPSAETISKRVETRRKRAEERRKAAVEVP